MPPVSQSLRHYPLDDLDLTLAQDSLSEYIKQAWPIIEPSTDYLHNWHIDAIAEYLEAVTFGQIRRLIINQPPRSMKSISVSVMWPTWEWGPRNMAHTRWLFGSFNSALSLKHSNDRRVIIAAPWYQERWGNRVRLSKDEVSEVVNSKRGHYIASSVGGPPHGKGGNRIIIDDLLNPEEAHSETERTTANRVFDSTYYQRLDNKKKDAIVIVMQRLHEEDVTGHVMKEQGWTTLILPAEASEEKTYLIMPRSKTVVMRERNKDTLIKRPGVPVERRADQGIIWPEREGRVELDKARFRLGSYGYSGQYQQAPAPEGGGIFKRAWFRQWRILPKPRRLVLSWDTAFKEKEENDFSVCQTWAETDLGFFLLDMWREKVESPELKRAAVWLNARWLPSVVLIEDKASGQSLIQELRRPPIEGSDESRMQTSSIPIYPVQVETDKVSRAHAASPLVEGGIVWVPEQAPWLEDFFYEVTRFPKAAHDDIVDTMVQALIYMRGSGATLEFYRRQVEEQRTAVEAAVKHQDLPPAAPNQLIEIYKRKMAEYEQRQTGGSAASEHYGMLRLPKIGPG